MSKNKLEVGYGRVDITPDYPVRMAGSAAVRLSEGFLDKIYMTFVALRQGEDTYFVITADLVGIYEPFSEPICEKISAVTGIPENRILLNSTHTHSSVSASKIELEGIARYREDMLVWVEEGAKAALQDLAPAEVYYGSCETRGMVWVRHYLTADKGFAGANYGSYKSGVVGHAYDPDPVMQLIKFDRSAENKKDVVLMNYPAHATINQSSTLLSADFPGPARDYVAEETGALVAYFIAGGGDQVPISRIAEENFSKDYVEYGREVGRYAVEVLKALKKTEDNTLRFSEKTYHGKSNKADMDRVDDALAVKAIWDQVGGRATKEGREAAKAHGFSSVYAVTAILNRMRFPEDRYMLLKALAIGEVSMIFAPYEMFGVNARQIRENSPYPMTFIASCSRKHDGYLPATCGCELRCYEAQITKFAYGTAEKLVDEYVDLLKTMKN